MKRDGSAGTHTDMWRGIPVSRNHYYKSDSSLSTPSIRPDYCPTTTPIKYTLVPIRPVSTGGYSSFSPIQTESPCSTITPTPPPSPPPPHNQSSHRYLHHPSSRSPYYTPEIAQKQPFESRDYIVNRVREKDPALLGQRENVREAHQVVI
ncbi:hypothetical protein BCIN_13g04450 [Botrytis cinerea B05.10]|uniref:Uncharacterized protein n=1 Tax=Botryotinia fuckeliana (strain B05.10) TaxID=332648 RepID=A0A384K1E0_BOTFB|nr:hypothetical protein BCIN_13g04450 [Botrytis cinerea B05.10]ATZ56608.1 hypothetical protein BCIN_13g04450 [Botrytis cinerea B05.10]